MTRDVLVKIEVSLNPGNMEGAVVITYLMFKKAPIMFIEKHDRGVVEVRMGEKRFQRFYGGLLKDVIAQDNCEIKITKRTIGLVVNNYNRAVQVWPGLFSIIDAKTNIRLSIEIGP